MLYVQERDPSTNPSLWWTAISQQLVLAKYIQGTNTKVTEGPKVEGESKRKRCPRRKMQKHPSFCKLTLGLFRKVSEVRHVTLCFFSQRKMCRYFMRFSYFINCSIPLRTLYLAGLDERNWSHRCTNAVTRRSASAPHLPTIFTNLEDTSLQETLANCVQVSLRIKTA